MAQKLSPICEVGYVYPLEVMKPLVTKFNAELKSLLFMELLYENLRIQQEVRAKITKQKLKDIISIWI
jgi:hypothetical protein